jgi:hypothetical protein
LRVLEEVYFVPVGPAAVREWGQSAAFLPAAMPGDCGGCCIAETLCWVVRHPP